MNSEIIQQFLEAKRLEAEVTARRVELGNIIAKELGAPEEGSKTHTVDAFKVTLKQPINRRVDWETFDEVASHYTDEHLPVVIKRELDTKGLHWIQKHKPGLYADIAKAITAKPGRVQVEVKAVTQ